MRKFFVAVLVAFCAFVPAAHADKMVNVEYIHKLIEQRWDIKIPYNPKLSTPKVAANMKYLLTLVDMTNKRINGTATTHYGDGEFATMAAADTVAANRAITKLVKIKPKFFITTTPDTETFEFRMSAKGRFMVDWGDNTVTQIVRKNTEMETYTHQYEKPGEYKIGIGGYATGYSGVLTEATIRFQKAKNIAKIDGSLGAIFGTIGDGGVRTKQPSFDSTFSDCSNMTGPIPENLFAGVHGKPTYRMFMFTFLRCTKLSGNIPAGLFAGLSGAPAGHLFRQTFLNCGELTGEIPAGMFGKLVGAPGDGMFMGTFAGCTKLSGPIPAGVFGDIKGPAAPNMFFGTFDGCSNLTGEIPSGLFGDISGPAQDRMFQDVFKYCRKLTGCVPDGLFGDIGMTLDEIIAEYAPFQNATKIITEYCPVDNSGATE